MIVKTWRMNQAHMKFVKSGFVAATKKGKVIRGDTKALQQSLG